MAISALPATLVATATSANTFEMADMTNTSTTEFRRVVQSVIIYNNSNQSTEFVVRIGGQTFFKETLSPAQTFAIEGFKLTQLNAGSFNNANTKLSVAVVTAGSTLNIAVTYTTINIT